tara:strand:+ start:227 stop:457 length:231 start_codon:yes stop_codon:yes gene_type:complete
MEEIFENDEYVTAAVVDICLRSFYLVSNEGVVQEITCESTDQFMDVLEIIHCVTEIDDQIQIIYSDIVVSENAGVV